MLAICILKILFFILNFIFYQVHIKYQISRFASWSLLEHNGEFISRFIKKCFLLFQTSWAKSRQNLGSSYCKFKAFLKAVLQSSLKSIKFDRTQYQNTFFNLKAVFLKKRVLSTQPDRLHRRNSPRIHSVYYTLHSMPILIGNRSW